MLKSTRLTYLEVPHQSSSGWRRHLIFVLGGVVVGGHSYKTLKQTLLSEKEGCNSVRQKNSSSHVLYRSTTYRSGPVHNPRPVKNRQRMAPPLLNAALEKRRVNPNLPLDFRAVTCRGHVHVCITVWKCSICYVRHYIIHYIKCYCAKYMHMAPFISIYSFL